MSLFPKTFVIVPKEGKAVRVQAEQMDMSVLHRSIRLFNGSRNDAQIVALFHTDRVIGVVEEDSLLAQPQAS